MNEFENFLLIDLDKILTNSLRIFNFGNVLKGGFL